MAVSRWLRSRALVLALSAGCADRSLEGAESSDAGEDASDPVPYYNPCDGPLGDGAPRQCREEEDACYGYSRFVDDCTTENFTACSVQCERAADCGPGASGTAAPICDFGLCVLSCEGGLTCPSGMTCIADEFSDDPCMWHGADESDC